jgi:hypothetical protein
MRITDTLDQLLRSLVSAGETLSAETREAARAEDVEPVRPGQGEPSALARDLAAAVDEVAVKRSHELERGTGPSDALETSTGAAESLDLGFHLGAAVERIALAAREGSEGALKLREAAWLIERYIGLLEQRPLGADLHASSARLAQARHTIDRLRELDPGVAAPTAAGGAAEEKLRHEQPARPRPAATPDPVPAAVVQELPSIRRELFVTAARAVIAVVTITAIVLLLTLIADWR